MGRKTIWDGQDLPEKGDLVLAHLSRIDAYIAHKVDRIELTPSKEKGLYRIGVYLEPSHDRRSSKNMRHLEQCFPLDTDPLDLPINGCLHTLREA